MPAIKKKWMKTNREDNSMKEDDTVRNESFEDEDKELTDPDSAKLVQKKPVKRSLQPAGTTMLKRLDGEVLLEKRKRFTPPAELKLSEWLDDNLEKRTEETIHLPLLYNYYTELCQADGSEILGVPEFNRMVKLKFGKAVGVQASSIYKTLIKERKMNEKKKGGGGFKLKEILIEAINHFGNPWQGVRFFNLKQYIGTRCPAMQIDSKPKVLKRALEMGTRFGYILLTKGVGMAGSYCLPGAVEPPPKPKVKAKKEGEAEGEADSEEADKSENKEENEESGDGKEDDSKTKDESVKEEGPTKPKKAKKVQAWSYSKISFSNPTRIEDVFPLAITYQSAPKAAGLPRIRRYIQEKYREEVPDNRWRKTVEHGVEKGHWEHVSGSGITGRIHLLMDDFDPSSEHLEDQICAAIIACHDPKIASANQIKKYVTKYHADFGVEQRPDRFKKALQRAMDKKMIRQISGLGANGSFQLVVPFTPTPTVLAGDDDSDEDAGDDKGDESTYIPRGTKSRGMPKIKTMEAMQSKKSKKTAPSSSRKGRAGKKTNDSSDDDEEEEKPVSKRGKSNNKNQSPKSKKVERNNDKVTKRQKRRAPSPLTDEEEEEEGDEEKPEYTPQKSHSRGGGSRQASPSKEKAADKEKKNKKKSVKPSPKTNKRSIKTADSGSEADEDVGNDSEPEYTPRKSTSRGGDKLSTPSQNGSRSSAKSLKRNRDDDSVNDSPIESTPKSGGGSSKGKSSGKKGRR